MSEEELRVMLQSLMSRVEDIRDNIKEIKTDNKEAHKAFAERLDALEHTAIEREPVVKAAEEHIKNDKSFDESMNGRITQIVIFVCSSAAGAAIGALVAKML